ncbi:MAG TPA: LamG-like jellyroll fold domain-containing protein [Candidatus Sulfotelmatobacter sp.]|nr:LamG-like jellyroll fold domain-containing protein [Candidatus Sulfotelmatobacter sp.]
MRRTFIWFIVLLIAAGVVFFVRQDHNSKNPASTQSAVRSQSSANATASAAAAKSAAASAITNKAGNKFAWRLKNTDKPLSQLIDDPRAILLENAFIETGSKLNLAIPKNLQSPGDPGAYVVQARGPISAAFRSVLAGAGATIVSYIPNNAYLVRASEGVADALAANPLVQAVIPYEPYYKVQEQLLAQAQQPLPADVQLNLGLFADDAADTVQQIQKMGGIILSEENSAAGYPIVKVEPPADWTAIAGLPGVHIVEPYYRRTLANDLARAQMQISADGITTTNYDNLYGSNVIVEVDDTGIDTNHPDFSNNHAKYRVFYTDPNMGTDTNGHGTHVAGIIAGDGFESTTVTNAYGSPMPGSPQQFRGKAPMAEMLSMNYLDADQDLQAAAAQTNALISNNSWVNGDADYDLEAASYDAATRDALPFVTGSQPVLFVFPSGDSGSVADSIQSPGTAKDVITVGALEEGRYITNLVTDASSNVTEEWFPETDDSNAVWNTSPFENVASGDGNVGIGTEGTYGRFKPDLVAPGTFVISCRSEQWDTNAYYNPTNNDIHVFADLIPTNSVSTSPFQFLVPGNAVEVIFSVATNASSPAVLPVMPIYLETNSAGYGLIGSNNAVVGPTPPVLNEDWSVVVSNTTASPLAYDLIVDVQTTNNYGNYYTVLQNMNDSLGPPINYYRYETGTSMSAPAVSGFLALLQDYFTNQYTPALIPSPALLKGLAINGALTTEPQYYPQINGSINYEGWGLPTLPNTIVPGITNVLNVPCSTFFRDQSLSNALATGESETFIVNMNSNDFGNYLPLHVTLAWTDPPGDPAAAIKLVNSLELVVTDLDNPGIVYYGNDIGAGGFNNVESATNPPIIDAINNVQNININPYPPRGTPDSDYSITVIGNRVNANAVSEQTNDIVQDYALVVSAGNIDVGQMSNAIENVSDEGVVANPTGDQLITQAQTNTILLNQTVGANTPLMGTNTVGFTTNTVDYGANGQFYVGMTNQWHFYVVTNTTLFTNAAFITFGANTLSIPRMGVFANSIDNATTPGADLDLLVTRSGTDGNAANLLNLDPVEISNCLNGASGDGASLVSGGTDFVAYSNALPNEVYYIGVKSESQMGVQYSFIPIFTDTPFGGLDQNGNEYVNALNAPSLIPDGTASHPGYSIVFGLALYPITIQNVIITNTIYDQNFGDLVGSVTHSGVSVGLNSHDSFGPGEYSLIYDGFGTNDTAGARPVDGPGSLQNYVGASGQGVWQFTEENNSLGQTGEVLNTQMFLQKYQNPRNGIYVTVQPMSWFYTYITIPAGYTNMELFGINTNLSPATPPIQMYLNTGGDPTMTSYLFEADLTNAEFAPLPPPFVEVPGVWNEISDGPPLAPGTYYIGLYNPSSTAEGVYLLAVLNGQSTVVQPSLFTDTNTVPVINDAVTSSTNTIIAISNTPAIISSLNVGFVVQYPRISDLAFTLISPQGQRILLMENRGGPTTTNAGGVFYITNSIGTTTANGSFEAQTNTYNVQNNAGSLSVSFNAYTIPDQLTIYYGNDPSTFNTNGANSTLLFNSGMIGAELGGNGITNFTVNFGPGTSTYVTFIVNQFGNTNGTGGDAWTYTINGTFPSYNYLTFTDDTNLTDTAIKFAIPPFDLRDLGTNYTFGNLDLSSNGDYFGLTNIYDAYGGWTVPSNQVIQVTNGVVYTNNYNEVSVISDPGVAFQSNTNSSNFLALGYGTIIRTNLLTPYRLVTVSYQYRGPGIAGWWRGEGDAHDSSDAEQHGQNGSLIGRFTFPAGEVSQAFAMENNGLAYDFAGTNSYVQIRQQPFYEQVITNSGTNLENTGPITIQSSYLDVGTGPGLTVEGWINPTNLAYQQPLVEWLARVPTNGSDTNLTIRAGPFLDRATSHYYYMLGPTNWTTSETWAEQIGGHLVTIDSANEQNWVYDTFASYGGRNRNLWIGLTNAGVTFAYSSGLTNIAYTNWLFTQPTNCGDPARKYTFMFGPTNEYAGNWALADNEGIMCGPVTNIMYGVVEVTNIQTNGVQFWISITNVPGTTNLITTNTGCLFANLVDITNGSHWIYSAPGLIQSNLFQHVALTYDTNSGIASLFYDGTNVATTNWGFNIVPKTTGDVLLGKDMSLETNNYYSGLMDEMSIYNRALSDAEIQAIYSVSAYTTNRLIGKFDPTITPPLSLAEAQVVLGNMTNTLLGQNNTWQQGSFTFIPQTNVFPMQVRGIQPGMLMDSFAVSEAPLGNLYYLPEQSLEELNGQSPNGNWTLEIWDTRNNALATNANLLSWQLQMILQSNTPPPITVGTQEPIDVTILPGEIVTLAVPVPAWAQEATNILVSSTEPLNVFYNPTNAPTGSVPPDYILQQPPATPVQTGSWTLTTNTPLPDIVQGGTYYIGLQNTGPHAASAVFQVDFNIMALTNDAPYSDTVTNDAVRYFSFNVTSTNAYEATFQLLHMNGNADLVVSKGTPLPTLTSSDYGSFNSGNADENIYVLTNSEPVPLSVGTWYIGVFNRDTHPVTYDVVAQELDLNPVSNTNLTIIPLTNGVPLDYTAGPGAALTNFFSFVVTNTVTNTASGLITNYVGSIHFELYNLTGNGDLTVQTDAPPFAPPFFQSSDEPSTAPEFIQIRTNSALTNLTATWYLGVPNDTTNLIHFTIIAVIDTNNVFPAFPGAEGAGAGALGGRGGDVYHVINLSDSGPGSLRYGITNFFGTGATNTPGTGTTNLPNGSITNVSGARTIVFDVSGIIHLLSPLVISNSYITIAGQTAPCGGVTVYGQMTTVQSAHDVVIRDVRFRRGSADDSLQFTNATEAIADHVSAEWTSDNQLSVLNSSNVTVQWSMLSDGLYSPTNNPPPIGALVRYGSGAVSLHHNLFADDYTGSPRLGDNVSLDFVNNVIYNWVTNAGYSSSNDIEDNPNGFTNYLNYICNYLIAGPNTITTNMAFWSGNTNTWLFQTNNFIDSDDDGVLNGANTEWDMFTNWNGSTNYYTVTNQFRLPPVSIDEAYLAYEKVLDFAGVDLCKRDPIDTNIVEHVRNNQGALESLPPLSGMVAWWKAEGNMLDSWGTNNGILTNGTFAYAPGEVGMGFSFNYSPVQIIVPDAPSLNFGPGQDFSLEGWIRAFPTNYYRDVMSIIDKRLANGGNCVGYDVNLTGGTLNFQMSDNYNSGTSLVQAGTFLADGKLHHIAVTVQRLSTTGGRIYEDGVLVNTFDPTGQSGDLTSTQPLRIGNHADPTYSGNPGAYFNGQIDDWAIYKRALTSDEVTAIYQLGPEGKFAWRPKFLERNFLDTDRDGIPDFWESTFGQSLTNANNNILSTNANNIGYSDLEEFDNWLAGPHAVTTTNTPVNVNLYQLCGDTGNLRFFLTNAVNGSVYLTNEVNTNGIIVTEGTELMTNTIAVFTPSNGITGYASFGFYVTNTDTYGYFGPVTVSVVVSPVPVTYTARAGFLPQNQPLTNTVCANTIEWYKISVPTNAVQATNTLIFAGAPVNFWYSSNDPPSTVNSSDFELLKDSTNGSAIINISGAPLPPVLAPGGTYFLGIQNTNNFATNYAVQVNFQTITPPPGGIIIINPGQPVTNIMPPSASSPGSASGGGSANPVYIPIFVPPNAISATNTLLFSTGGATSLWFNQTTWPGFGATPGDVELIANYAGTTPTNYILTSNSIPPLMPGQTYYLAIDNTSSATVTNAFEYTFDLYYTPPILPPVTNIDIVAGNTLNVNDEATDTNAGTLVYYLTTMPDVTNATISTTGQITWTVPTNTPGENVLFTTVVSNSFTTMTATNEFTVTVLPLVSPVLPQTNSVASNSVNWLAVPVPVDANHATNILLFATNLPVNVLFTTNFQPAVAGAYTLMSNQMSGVSILGTGTVPTNIVPGSVYYLGIQNTNSLAVGYALQVNFGYYPAPVLPAISNLVITAGQTLTVTNSATDSSGVGILYYALTTSPSVNATISLTNGVITWATAASQALGNYVFTTIVTNSATTLSATNTFKVTVIPAPEFVRVSIIYTNISGTNGFLLTWFAATNDYFKVQETPALVPPVWNSFTNIIAYAGPVTATNGLFSFFDNGSQYPFGVSRFYRLLLLEANGLTLPVLSNYVLSVSEPLSVTNTAIDSDPAAILDYNLTGFPDPATNALISTNGVITWIPGPGDAGSAFTFTTTVSDNGLPPAKATNAFTVFVLPAPVITASAATPSGVTFQWTASTNDLFQVEWTTNLISGNWTLLPQVISSSTGSFTFTDNDPSAVMKFYRLVWLPPL